MQASGSRRSIRAGKNQALRTERLLRFYGGSEPGSNSRRSDTTRRAGEVREGVFLVDTGSTDSLVPSRFEAIGLLNPGGKNELADGSETPGLTGAEIEFSWARSLAERNHHNSEPLLGVTALESVGIEVDPLNQRLKRLPAVRLKGLA